MTLLEHLPFAAALAHTVPGAELRLSTVSGGTVVVGRGPRADVGPCAFRRIVAAGLDPCRREPFGRHLEFVHHIELAGSATDRDAGVYSTGFGNDERHWIVSDLDSAAVACLLADVGSDRADRGLHARVCHDPDLAVTVVEFSAVGERANRLLGATARGCAAACYAEELMASTRDMIGGDQHHGGSI